jgi:hypothetical protein
MDGFGTQPLTAGLEKANRGTTPLIRKPIVSYNQPPDATNPLNTELFRGN